MQNQSKKVQPAPASNKMLFSIEAAEVVGLKPDTLNQWRYRQHEGQPPYHKMGRAVRYRLSELEAWLQGNAVGG